MNKSLQKLPRAEQWADQICTQLGKSVASIVEAGRLLVRAKADLAHGEWGRIFDEKLVPFSPATARKLMTIADSPQISNRSIANVFPPNWTTLYELSKLPEPTLKHALSGGLITPDMSRSAVKGLMPAERKPAPESTPVQAKPVVAFEMPRWADQEIDARVQAVLNPVRDLIEAWPDDQDFTILIHHLQEISRYLERLASSREVSA